MSFASLIAAADRRYDGAGDAFLNAGTDGVDAAQSGGGTITFSDPPSGIVESGARAFGLDNVAYILMNSSKAYSGAFTFSCWCTRDNTANFHMLLGQFTDNKLGWSNNSTATFNRVVSGAASAGVSHGVDSTAWNMYTVTRDASNVCKLTLNTDSPITLFTQSGSSSWRRFGSDEGSVNRHQGKILVPSLWTGDHSAADIAELHAGPPNTANRSTIGIHVGLAV